MSKNKTSTQASAPVASVSTETVIPALAFSVPAKTNNRGTRGYVQLLNIHTVGQVTAAVKMVSDLLASGKAGTVSARSRVGKEHVLGHTKNAEGLAALEAAMIAEFGKAEGFKGRSTPVYFSVKDPKPAPVAAA